MVAFDLHACYITIIGTTRKDWGEAAHDEIALHKLGQQEYGLYAVPIETP